MSSEPYYRIRSLQQLPTQTRIQDDSRYIFVVIAEVNGDLSLCSRHNQTVHEQSLASLNCSPSPVNHQAGQQRSVRPDDTANPNQHRFIPLIAHSNVEGCEYHELEDPVTRNIVESADRPWYVYGRRAELKHLVSGEAYMVSRACRVFRVTTGSFIFFSEESVPRNLDPEKIYTLEVRSASPQYANEPKVKHLVLKWLVRPWFSHSALVNTSRTHSGL